MLRDGHVRRFARRRVLAPQPAESAPALGGPKQRHLDLGSLGRRRRRRRRRGACLVGSFVFPLLLCKYSSSLTSVPFWPNPQARQWQVETNFSASLASQSLTSPGQVPPKHKDTVDLFASGKRYTPAHHLALISPLALDDAGKMT